MKSTFKVMKRLLLIKTEISVFGSLLDQIKEYLPELKTIAAELNVLKDRNNELSKKYTKMAWSLIVRNEEEKLAAIAKSSATLSECVYEVNKKFTEVLNSKSEEVLPEIRSLLRGINAYIWRINNKKFIESYPGDLNKDLYLVNYSKPILKTCKKTLASKQDLQKYFAIAYTNVSNETNFLGKDPKKFDEDYKKLKEHINEYRKELQVIYSQYFVRAEALKKFQNAKTNTFFSLPNIFKNRNFTDVPMTVQQPSGSSQDKDLAIDEEQPSSGSLAELAAKRGKFPRTKVPPISPEMLSKLKDRSGATLFYDIQEKTWCLKRGKEIVAKQSELEAELKSKSPKKKFFLF